MPKPRPTYGVIMQRLEEARSHFSRLREEMRTDEEYWTASSELWKGQLAAHIKKFPDNYDLKIPGIVKFSVDVGINQIMVGETPSVTVTLPSQYRDEERKKRLEEAFTGILYAIDTYYGQPLRNMAAYGNALGLGVLSFPIDRQQWPPHPYHSRVKPGMSEADTATALAGRNPKEHEAIRRWEWQRSRRLPWNVQTLHPLNFFFDPWSSHPEWYIEEKEVAQSAMMVQYPHLFPDNVQVGSSRPSSKLVIYVDEDWYAVYLDGAACLTEKQKAIDGVAPNRYGMTWIEMAESGYGTPDARNDPVFRIKGVIRDNRATFDKFIADFNLVEITKLQYGLPTMGFEGMGDNGKELAEQEMADFIMGRYWPHSDRVKQHVLNLPNIPQAVWDDFEMTQRLLEIGIGPEVLRGEFKDDTATGQATRLEQAKAMYRTLKAEMEHAIAAMLSKMAWQVKYELDEDLTFWAKMQGKDLPVTLRKSDIVDGMKIHVDTTPPTNQERAFKKQGDLQDLQVGAINIRQYRQRQGIFNSDEIEEQNLEDSLMGHQAIIDVVATFLSQRIVGQSEEAMAVEEAEGIASGMPPVQPLAPSTGGGQAGALTPPAVPVSQELPAESGVGTFVPRIAVGA